MEPYLGNAEDQFTIVELDGIGEEYTAQLNNAAEVGDYLLNTIPVAFSSDGYGKTVNEWLAERVGLNPVRVSLRIADESPFDIEPLVAEDVYSPESDWIKSPDGTALAFVWYALSTDGRQLPAHDGSAVSGFLMKVKGFTLGDRLALKGLWPAVGGGTLYHHYTGEVHILATDQLFPNAARNDLESSPARLLFKKQAEDFFYPLSRKARVMQAQTRAVRLLEGIDRTLGRLRQQRDSPNINAYDLYRDSENYRKELENVLQEIERHLRKPRGRPRVQLDYEQQTSVDAAIETLHGSIKELGGVSKDAQRRTERPSRQVTQPPPQVEILMSAISATLQMAERTGDSRYTEAAKSLEPLANSMAFPRAIGVLDELKASGMDLGAQVESARRELRASIGWSPLAPVSLEESLAQQGVPIEGTREEQLVRAIDQGLMVGLGGRGPRFEAVLRAIAEAIAEKLGS